MRPILARASSLWRLAFCSAVMVASMAITNTASASTGYTAKYWNLPEECGSSPAFPETAPDATGTTEVINFNWEGGSPAAGINADCFAAEWTKTETFPANDYVFSVNIDDGARVYLDDVLILDQWSDHGDSGYTVLKHVSAGSHAIKVRYYENGGGAVMRFSYHQPYSRHSTWGTNGAVFGLDTAPDGTVYVGGSFSYAGPYTGGAVPVSATTGVATTTFPQFDGTVNTVVPDGSGGWYVGGSFVVVGEPAIQNLAHVDAHGLIDTSWTPNPDNTVLGIARSGSSVFVSGGFSIIGGAARPYLAEISATTGLATSWNPSPNNWSRKIIVSDGILYVSGYFTAIASETRHYLAAFELSGKTLTSWNPDANNEVDSMFLDGSRLYVGGTFTSLNSSSTLRAGAIDVATGNKVYWPVAFNGTVTSLAASGTTVYVGGYFTSVNSTARSYLASVDGETGELASWNPNPDNSVEALTVFGGKLYVGGNFVVIDGAQRLSMAAFNADGTLATGWRADTSYAVYSLSGAGDALYLGGAFTSAGGVPRNNAFALDPDTGEATSWNPNTNNAVYTLKYTTSTVYMGGAFTNVGGSDRLRAAAVSTEDASVTAWDPSVDNEVYALAIGTSTVYMGGYFSHVSSTARQYIAATDKTTGTVIDAWNPGADSTVRAFVYTTSTLYVGGNFRRIGGRDRGYIAALDLNTGAATSWDASGDNSVYTLAIQGDTLYAGGDFSLIGRGAPRARIAALRTTTGLATAWDPSANNGVRALAASSHGVYAGGYFGYIGGTSRTRFAELNPSLPTGDASSLDLSPDNDVLAMSLFGNQLTIGGYFGTVETHHVGLAQVDIQDVQFGSTTSSGSEVVTTVHVPIELNQALSEDATIFVSASGGTATAGTDYTFASGTVTIPAGQTTTTVDLTIIDDTAFENTETVVLSLSSPSINVHIGPNSAFTYSIKDNDFVGYESHDESVAPVTPGDLADDAQKAGTVNGEYWITALSQTDGGYDSQVFKFHPDLTGLITPKFTFSWTGHGDTPEDKLVHFYAWNFASSSWSLIDEDHCSEDCSMSGFKVGSDYYDTDHYVWVWAKADNNYHPPVISSVTDNSMLLPISWTTDIDSNSEVAYDTISHADGNWDDYGHYASSSDFGTEHYVTPALYNTNGRPWNGLAMNASGTKMVGVPYNGNIWTSNDSGATWVEQTGSGVHAWSAVTMSADGMTVLAAVNGGHIWMSGDAGVTWTENTSTSISNWTAITMTRDGSTAYASVWGGRMWKSINGGVDWTELESSPSEGWARQIAVSDDGQTVLSGSWCNELFLSTNGGADWTMTVSARHCWHGAAMSSDGQTLAASVDGGYVWTSPDAGLTWTENTATYQSWQDLAMTPSGSKLAGLAYGGYVLFSTDNGASFSPGDTALATSWSSLAMSADAQVIAAGVYNADIYVSTNGGTTLRDKTGTTWYYRVRSADADGDATTTEEFALRYTAVSSCPFVFTFDGAKYNFIIDASNSANLSTGLDKAQWKVTPWYKDPNTNNGYPNPLSFDRIPGDKLVPHTVGGETYYDIKTTTELQETNYYDSTALQVVDHSPSTEVYADYRNNGQIHTVLKTAEAPVTVTDQTGTDVKSLVASDDDAYWHSDMTASPSYLQMKLSNATTTPAHLKLVIKRGKEGPLSGGLGSDKLQYKNALGAFVNVPSSYDIFVVTRDGAPHASRNLVNTYGIETKVIDLSGLSIKDNTIRLVTTNNQRQWDIDWLAVDTSPDEAVTVTTEHPYYADLHERGISELVKTNPSDPRMTLTEPVYDHVVRRGGGGIVLSGLATKYGNVEPLLDTDDDKFVVMVQGDELTLKYAVPSQAEGTERDFIYRTWDYHKPAKNALGDQIGPLPFSAMTQYPYHEETEHYPTDADHQAYLDTYNTRAISWGVSTSSGESLHHSLNTDRMSLVVEDTVVHVPTSFAAVADSQTQITLTWNGDASEYNASYSDGSSGWSTSTTYVVTGLTCGTTYNFSVKARNLDLTESSSASTSGATQACPSTGGGGGFVAPPPVGSGSQTTSAGGIGGSASIGPITTAGTNAFTYVYTANGFTAPESGASWQEGPHTFTVTDLDTYRQVVTITFASKPTTVKLAKGESRDVDLDGDGVNDVRATFSGLYINRVEVTVVSLARQVGAGSLVPTATSTTAVAYQFKRNLKQGDKGEDVKQLQKFLNTHGFVVAKKGAGSLGKESTAFGPGLKAAIIKFQEKNAATLLKPAKLKKGTGLFSTATRALVNKLLSDKR